LFNTAVLVSKELRRKSASARERLDLDAIAGALDARQSPEEILEERRFRALLDALLEALPSNLRQVFVLYELEGLQMIEIAKLLEVPPGTVASRLRRARAEFGRKVRLLKARQSGGSSKP
jgi:RNA polymerase sigma-70 factor (ECF subfamily)